MLLRVYVFGHTQWKVLLLKTDSKFVFSKLFIQLTLTQKFGKTRHRRVGPYVSPNGVGGARNEFGGKPGRARKNGTHDFRVRVLPVFPVTSGGTGSVPAGDARGIALLLLLLAACQMVVVVVVVLAVFVVIIQHLRVCKCEKPYTRTFSVQLFW